MTISEMCLSDKNALCELFLQERRILFHWVDASVFHLSDFDSETKGEYILVARSNGSIAGFISIWLKDNFIHHLYIAKKFQNQGIGTKLLRVFLETSSIPVQLKCLQQNKQAISFYKKNGFIEKETGSSGNEAYLLLEHPGFINFK